MSTDTILTPEEIGRIAVAHGCDPDLDDGALVMRLCRAIEQAVLQSPEIRALRKDAERYRFMRSVENGAVLEAAIDAAMEKQT